MVSGADAILVCVCAAQGQTDRLRAAILDHRSSFVTEADFAAMAADGVNAVRLPVGYWALEMSAVRRLPPALSPAASQNDARVIGNEGKGCRHTIKATRARFELS